MASQLDAKASEQGKRRLSKAAELGLLAAILALGAYLRLNELADYPTWFFDEGTYISQSYNLSQGRFQVFDAPLLTQGPLTFLIAGFFFRFLDHDILTARLIGSGWGIASIVVVYLLGRKLYGRGAGLIAASILAVYPAAVFWNRLFMPDNLAGFLFAACLLALVHHLESRSSRSAVATGALAGLATLTKLSGGAAVLAILTIAVMRGDSRRNLILLLLSALVVAAPYPIVGYAGNLMGWHDVYARMGLGEWFGQGLLGGRGLEGAFMASFVMALGYLAVLRRTEDQVLLVAALAQFVMFAVGYLREWHIAQFAFLPALVFGRLTAEVHAELPQNPAKSATLVLLLTIMPVTKVVSLVAPPYGVNAKLALIFGWLGLASLAYLLAIHGRVQLARIASGVLALGVFLLIPAWYVQDYVFGELIFINKTSAAEFREAAAFLKARVKSTDLMLANPALISQLDSEGALGGFIVDKVKFKFAKYAAVDQHWRQVARQEVPDDVKGWPVLFANDGITIYQNPRFRRLDLSPYQGTEDRVTFWEGWSPFRGAAVMSPDEGGLKVASSVSETGWLSIQYSFDEPGDWSGVDGIAVSVRVNDKDALSAFRVALTDSQGRWLTFDRPIQESYKWQRVYFSLSHPTQQDSGFDRRSVSNVYFAVMREEPAEVLFWVSDPLVILAVDDRASETPERR